jgi:glyoxylase-like metal-dependent hydrolase (beta-lactamase superfamily II)
MSDASSNAGPPPPDVVPGGIQEVASGVFVIPDNRVPLVPNIGVILGDEAALVVDTGMGPVNGRKVFDAAKRIAGTRRLIVTLTHFHPEHGFGAQAFKGSARMIYNATQRDELREKGSGYLEMFRTFGDTVAAELEGVELIEPSEVYEGDLHELDLGGRTVELRTWGLAHTRGDQVVFLPDERVLFTGDLVEERCFAIFPYFPPDDVDVDGDRWIAVLEQLEALEPRVVVPGHGEAGGPSVISEARAYLTLLRDETRRRKAEGASSDATVEAIDASMRALHPDWVQPEWIGFGVRHFYDVE